MKTVSYLLLSAWLAASARAYEPFIKPICTALNGGWVDGCSVTYDYPYDAVRKTCNGVTCGITILYKKVKICDSIRDMPGGGGPGFLPKFETTCGSLAYMRQFAEATSNEKMWKYGDLSSVSHPVMLDTMTTFERNLIDNDFVIGGGRSNIIYQTFTKPAADGWKFARGADYDLDTYRELLKGVRPCWETSGCDTEKLYNAVSNYLWDSDGITEGELDTMLRGWTTLFTTIESQIATAKAAASLVQARLKLVNNKIAAVKKKVCIGTSCQGPKAKAYLTKVSQAMTAVGNLKTIPAACDKGTNAAKSVRDRTWVAISDIRPPNGDVLASKLLNGEVNDAYDFLKFFPIATTMEDHVQYLREGVSLVDSVATLARNVQSARTLVDGILTQNFKTDPDFQKTAATRLVRDGFGWIQDETRKQLKDPMLKLYNALKSVDTSLGKFQPRNYDFEWYSTAVKYSWYTVNSFPVPCTTMKTQSWTLGTYQETSKPFPTYETCDYGPEILYFPNRFIPYYQWRWY